VFHRFGPFRPYPVRELWWVGLAHLFFTLAIVGLLVALGVLLARSLRKHPAAPATAPPPFMTPPAGHPVPGPDAALSEARMRYARGELSREDFLRISEDLGGTAQTPG